MPTPLEQIMQMARRDVRKSAIDSTSLPNSILNRQQADAFIDLVVDESVLLKQIRTVRVDHPSGEINKLDLGSIVTEGAASTSKATTRTPTERVVAYDTVKYRSAFDLRRDFLEDNIEGTSARGTILNMFSKRVMIDCEIAAIESDDSLSVGDSQSDENNLLGVNQGFKKILENTVPSAQQIDAAGAAPSKDLYYKMKEAIPSRYRVVMPDYRFIVSSGVYDKWWYDWSSRSTVGGDAALRTGQVPGPWGVPMLEVPRMPEDLTYSGSSDATQIWMTPPSNLLWFVQRDITIDWDLQPRQDAWEVTMHFRYDFQIENPDLVVIAKNVRVSQADYSS